MARTTRASGPSQHDASGLAVVTGANRGLGLETCRQLAKRGMAVLLTARDGAKAQAAAATLAREGLAVTAQALDVSDAASVAALADPLRTQGRFISALVNNAGISMRGFNAEVARGTLDVNFHGAARVTDALWPLLTPDASVVMVSSGMGELSSLGATLRARFLRAELSRAELDALAEEFCAAVSAGTHERAGWPGSAYRVSKALLNALARVLAREGPGGGVRVNAVCPGWVRTDMGGRGASRGVEMGARGIVWAATLDADGPSGGFFRDGKAIDW